jgi:flotillin
LKIQNVTDDAGYLNSIGRIRGASVRMTATIAEANAQADAAEQQAKNWAAAETAKVDADLAIAQQDNAKRVADAQTKRSAMIAEAQAAVAAQLAQITAEIDRQKARAPQVKRQLEADVVQPAVAEQRSREEQAKGQAASVIERGKAEAEALRSLVEAYRKAGSVAREVLALQKLIPLVPDIAGARQKLSVGRVTVLPADESGAASKLAKTAIGASAQIKAATGVDLAAAVRRLGEPK